MLVACRLAGLSALETYYAGQGARAMWADASSAAMFRLTRIQPVLAPRRQALGKPARSPWTDRRPRLGRPKLQSDNPLSPSRLSRSRP
jgi:hypothetical protein